MHAFFVNVDAWFCLQHEKKAEMSTLEFQIAYRDATIGFVIKFGGVFNHNLRSKVAALLLVASLKQQRQVSEY